MEQESAGHLFVSYSHVDVSVMQMFRKHLQGMLRGRVRIWSDQGIARGAEWETIIKGSMTQANAAFVLASPDYLISQWCREELKALTEAYHSRRLRYLFWVQLRPCGWQHTELANFQSFAPSIEQAISEAPSDTQRDRLILQACEQIASEAISAVTEKDRQLATVRSVLAQADKPDLIKITGFLDAGPFCITCRGSMGSFDVVVKMLRNLPLEQMKDDFLRIGQRRSELSGPSFVRVHKVFPVSAQDETHIFVVSEFLNKNALLSQFLKEGQPLAIDRAAALLRRTAEALVRLHGEGDNPPPAVTPDTEWEWTVGFLKPKDIYYDQDSNRLQIAALGVSRFLAHVLDWDRFVQWVDTDAGAYMLPERAARSPGRVDRRADQYVLGRLGLELLEGKSFDQILEGKRLDTFWKGPEAFIKGSWKRTHPQLWGILARMLKESPADRWPSMSDVASKLSGLEKSSRAHAKLIYRRPAGDTGFVLEGNVEFFKSFYKRFIRASEVSAARFGNEAESHKNLMGAMVAVLNFHEGNEPTSLDGFLARHKNITKEEFEAFHDCFLEELQSHLRKQKPYDAKSVEDVVQSWRDLFRPAVDYMIARCTNSDSTANGGHKVARAAAHPNRREKSRSRPSP